jgi:hypothetical protein
LKALDPVQPVVRYEREAPGELLHMDTKKLGRIVQPSAASAAIDAMPCEEPAGSSRTWGSTTTREWASPCRLSRRPWPTTRRSV